MQEYLEKIGFEEGDKSKPYKCPANKWTIGKGINIEAQPMPHDVACLWARLCPDLPIIGNSLVQGLVMVEHGLPKEVTDLWAEIILGRLEAVIIDKLFDEYDINFVDLPKDCRIVIIDCCYQMGIKGFFGFKKTLASIKNLDWEDASIELLNSKYYRDTPSRATRNSELLFGCEAPF